MKNNNNASQGFSLLELIISLAIMAMLVQLAVPSYKSYINRVQCLQEQAKQMEQEIIEHGRYLTD